MQGTPTNISIFELIVYIDVNSQLERLWAFAINQKQFHCCWENSSICETSQIVILHKL